MEYSRRNALESYLKEALREHQHEGLHVIGGTGELIERLVRAVDDWERGTPIIKQKSA